MLWSDASHNGTVGKFVLPILEPLEVLKSSKMGPHLVLILLKNPLFFPSAQAFKTLIVFSSGASVTHHKVSVFKNARLTKDKMFSRSTLLWILPGVNKIISPLITERLVAALPPPPLFQKLLRLSRIHPTLVSHTGIVNSPHLLILVLSSGGWS